MPAVAMSQARNGAAVAATRVQAPQAAIVHDKFHAAKLLNEAVGQTRRAEHALSGGTVPVIERF
jgi:hypothetical protein